MATNPEVTKRRGRYVKLTPEVIEAMFHKCNRLYFDNEVDTPDRFDTKIPCESAVGWAVAKWNVKEKRFLSFLCVSNRYKWTEEHLEATVIHEMIHLKLKDYLQPTRWWHFFRREHGRKFRREMNRLNEKYGLNQTIHATYMIGEEKKRYQKQPNNQIS